MLIPPGKNNFGVFDYIVVVATFLFSLLIGAFYAVKDRKSSNNEELLTGSRKMGVLPVAASILVSYLSAIEIMAYPAEVYSFGCQFFLMTLLKPITVTCACWLFVEVMYDLKLTSAYKYLEGRYDSIAVRWMVSFIFVIQLLLFSGIAMYAPAIVLETMLGLPVWITVIGISICATIYTSVGGIKAVIWTDVFQFVMIFVGMAAILTKALSNAGGLSKAFLTASNNGRLELFNWTVDPFMRLNTLNIILGNGFGSLFFVIHQPVVQRYCSLPTFKDALKSIMWTYVFRLFTVSIVIITGISIYSSYAECDPLTSGQISKSDQIVPFFVMKELAFIPGMQGLFVAVVFSAILSLISSTLNSLAAVTWEDFLIKIPWFRNMDDFGQSCTYKILTITYSVITVVLALYAKHLGSIFQAAITVVSTAVSIQGSVFLMGVFMAFVNKIGAVVGMIVGLVLMGCLSVNSFILQKKYKFQPMLTFSTDACSDEILAEFENSTVSKTSTILPASELEYPMKLFTVSYILYPLIGGVITISTAVLVSLLTGGREQAQFVKPQYLHRVVRPKKLNKLVDSGGGNNHTQNSDEINNADSRL